MKPFRVNYPRTPEVQEKGFGSLLPNTGKLKSLYLQILSKAMGTIYLPKENRLPMEMEQSFLRELSISVTLAVIRLGIFFKHEAYKNESEYRFLQIHRGDIPAPAVFYRQRPYSLVRYRNFFWKPAAAPSLRKIIVGPAAGDKAIAFANDCLRAFHNGRVRVEQSKVPYRTIR